MILCDGGLRLYTVLSMVLSTLAMLPAALATPLELSVGRPTVLCGCTASILVFRIVVMSKRLKESYNSRQETCCEREGGWRAGYPMGGGMTVNTLNPGSLTLAFMIETYG